MRRDLNAGRFSGFQSWQEISTNNRNVKATTFYLGSRSSPRFARVYDKGLESGQFEEAEKLIRFEFVFRSEQCQVVAQLLLNEASVVSDVAGLTFNLYRFGSYLRNAKNQVWKNSRWYQKILDSFEDLKLRDMPALPRNIDFERYCKWLTDQVAPQLKKIAFNNRMSPGKVLDTILYYHQAPLNLRALEKNSYSQAFKKMCREKDEVFRKGIFV
jgi:DNA relaxase NicK